MRAASMILVLAVFVTASIGTVSIASAIDLIGKYVGNVIIDLEWSRYTSGFSRYELSRDGEHLATVTNSNTTFYRDEGRTKGTTYNYRIEVYDNANTLKESKSLSVTAGEVHGEITRDVSWTKALSPYTLTGDVSVASTAKLAIEPGCTINGDPQDGYWCEVEIQGGKPAVHNVTFNGAEIEFRSVTGGSVTQCTFTYGKSQYSRAIHLLSAKNCTVEDNTITGYWIGITLENATNTTVTNNTVGRLPDQTLTIMNGIELKNSSNTVITKNTITQASHGIRAGDECNNNTCAHNTTNDCGIQGIAFGGSNNTLLHNTANTCFSYGIFMYGSNHTLEQNTANSGKEYGIYMKGSNHRLKNNTATWNKKSGITLWTCTGCTLTDNLTEHNIRHGIEILESSDNTVKNNRTNLNSYYGISLNNSSHRNRIEGNHIADNTRRGIALEDSSRLNIITGNRVVRNKGTGISLTDSDNNTISNNYFNNGREKNAYDTGSNTWNTAKSSGTNIVGGPFLGGNYWDDYPGKDTNNDGIGDTQVPFNAWGGIQKGGDNFPLAVWDIIVNSTGDAPDNGASIDTCDTGNTTPEGDCECTLRAAIQTANARPGKNRIVFDIPPGGGIPTLQPGSALPMIEDSVVIDGTTQPGGGKVELDGTNAKTGRNTINQWEKPNGLHIIRGNSTVKGLIINRFKGNGIVLEVYGDNVIQGCFIGTNSAGDTDLGNALNGIHIISTGNNTIGGAGEQARNVISGNDSCGVLIGNPEELALEPNKIQGNYIGTNAAGEAKLGNAVCGVCIDGSPRNTIGGGEEKFRNLISGNNGDGIIITGEEATENKVLGNYIGTDAAGETKLGNDRGGVTIEDAPKNRIGGLAGTTPRGPCTGECNVISGNGEQEGNGIFISGDKARGNRIWGNRIGTTAAGTGRLGNGGAGIRITEADSTLIDTNVISGNGGSGVALYDDADGNTLLFNSIGTSAAGDAAIGNAYNGILIFESSRNTVGRGDAPSNLISGNDKCGVLISGSEFEKAAGNIVQSNYIGTNLSGETPLPNRDCGIYIANADSNTIGPGEAGALGNLISGNTGHGIKLSRKASANTVQNNMIGLDVTGSAKLGNTSDGIHIEEYASKNKIGPADTWAGGNIIAGNGDDGIEIQKAQHNRVWSNYIGTNRLDDTGLGNTDDGVSLVNASYDTIGGMAGSLHGLPCLGGCNVISGNSGDGIEIQGSDAQFNLVIGNNIGLDSEGEAKLKNIGNGVLIEKSHRNTITGNLISGNESNGIKIQGSLTMAAMENVVLSNKIGTNAAGTKDVGNTLFGVHISNGYSTRIIHNVISGNDRFGVRIEGKKAEVNGVFDNRIGTGLDVTVKIPNNGGVWLSNRNNAAIDNIIRYNCTGIRDDGENIIRNNSDENNACGTGIHCDGCTSEITGNTIARDETDGIKCENGAKPVLHGNNILNNTGNGLINTDAGVTINAQGNWWGDASGPGGAGPGSGDEVSGAVDFSNWLTGPVTVVVTVAVDTIFVPVGGIDSVYCSLRNWQNPNDVLNVTFEADVMDWLIGPTDFSVALPGDMGAVTHIGLTVPSETSSGAASKVKITASSQTNANDSDADSFYVTAYQPGLVTITVVPDSVRLRAREGQQFAAHGLDVANKLIDVDPLWTASGGTIDSTGFYTAGCAGGSFAVTAKDRTTEIEGQAQVRIDDPCILEKIEISPDFVELAPGQRQQFGAAGFDSLDLPVPIEPLWTATGGIIDSFGLYTAGMDTGSFVVTVTDASTGMSAQTQVVILVPEIDYEVGLSLSEGLNMISLPVIPQNDSVGVIFPDAIGFWAYENGSYTTPDRLRAGVGYWYLSLTSDTISVVGFPVETYTIALSPGWNLIGALDGTVDFTNPNDTPDDCIVPGTLWWYTHTGNYVSQNTLESGKGYWILAVEGCYLTADMNGPARTLSDDTGAFEFALSKYGMPPPPPGLKADHAVVAVPEHYELSQNYPNPFNPETEIVFSLPVNIRVTLTVYNILGQVVKTLIDSEMQAGYHRLTWNGKNVSSGIYFYRITAGEFTDTKRMVLLK